MLRLARWQQVIAKVRSRRCCLKLISPFLSLLLVQLPPLWLAPGAEAETLEELKGKVERLEKAQRAILDELESFRRTLREKETELTKDRAEAERRQREEMAKQEAELAKMRAESERRRQEEAATQEAEATSQQTLLEALQLRQELDTRLLERRIDEMGRPKTGFLSRGFGGSFAIDVAGYIKTDINWADQELQDGDLLLFARPKGTPLDERQFTVSLRETLLAFHIQGPKILGAMTGGKISMDFFGDITGQDKGANIVQPRPNLRSAFTDFLWKSEDGRSVTDLLIGIDHTAFGNYFPELFTFAKGVDSGTFFLLAPGIRLTHLRRFGEGQSVRVSLSALRSTSGVFGIGGGLNTGNNLIGVGEASGEPEFQGSISYSNDFLGTAPFWGIPTPFTVGISGLFGQERLVDFRGIRGNNRTFDKSGVDLKLFIPIIGSTTGDPTGTLFLKAYGTLQQNLDEGVGNGVQGIVVKKGGNPLAVRDFESSYAIGGWVELGYYVRRDLFVTAMFGTLNEDDNDGVIEGFAFPSPKGGFTGIKRNLRYTGGIKKYFGSNILAGVEYTRLETDFQDGVDGTTNNVLFAIYYFF